MDNTNTFFMSDDEENKGPEDTEIEMEENDDLLFDDSGETDKKNDEEKGDSEDEDEDKDDKIEDDKSNDDSDNKSAGNSFGVPDESLARDSKDNVTLSKSKITLIKKLLQNAKESNDKVIELLSVFSTDETDRAMISQMSDEAFSKPREEISTEEGNIIEGVFDGETMIGPDGKEYSIPANYASKSKLVEGDILKLTILNNGTFIYKQIVPIDRDRIIGKLESGSNGQFIVTFEGKKWKVLTASVTYFKGNMGDEVIILVPKNADSQWAAVDNIVRNKEY
ncbi:MAG: hypothetical protein PF572_04015 [Patescibacteria group bacterium]|jgi:hypothetical protein|nr:hypothetical protein [Patescibacteria group bacterium]